MGTLEVDQISSDGTVFRAVDVSLNERQKNDLLLEALTGAKPRVYSGVRVVQYGNQVLLKKQVTHLGYPWPEFKKRIQIPKSWLDVERQARADGLTVRFVGIYHHDDVTLFIDFDPTTYVERKANNSAAHVATNDLYQAQILGQFSREDKNGNRITSIRSDQFASYLERGFEERNQHIRILDDFTADFLTGHKTEALVAVKEMHEAGWPDKFQNEWAGFYVEFMLSRYLESHGLKRLVEVQKDKRRGQFDYDLRFLRDGVIAHYGDLKASSVEVKDSPGNDAGDFYRCLEQYGRFWFVIFEHETWHGRDNGDRSTVEWNQWRRDAGHKQRKHYDPLSYARRFKEAVRFVNVKVLEVNQANAGLVLGKFQKDFRQPDGSLRGEKVLIKKKHMDNFLIYTRSLQE